MNQDQQKTDHVNEFFTQHPEFYPVNENFWTDGVLIIHVSILSEYVDSLIEKGHLKDSGTYVKKQ